MKKIFLSNLIILGCGMLTSCGVGTTGVSFNPQQQTTPTQQATTGGDILGSVANQLVGGNSILGNIISTFAPGITTNQSTIVGTWKYAKPCVQFESENLLAKAGGTLAASKVEEKLAAVYQLAGIKAGACNFVFGNNNTVQYTIGGRTSTGTYTFNAQNKTITITTQHGVQVTAYVSIVGNMMGLTFDASKLLSLAGAASSLMNKGMTALIGNYNGMKVGFAFTK